MTKWTQELLPRTINNFHNDRENFLRADSRTNTQALSSRMWGEMMQSSYFVEHMLPKISKEKVGNPFKLRKYPDISPYTAHHLYYIYSMITLSNYNPFEDPTLIVDFGGGYGNVCRVLYELGYQGDYIIIDFPEQFTIQKYFLEENGVDLSKIKFMELDNLHNIYSKIKNNKTCAMGTYSISEMPLEDRNKIIPTYKMFDYIFIAYKANIFDGVDNVTYFKKLCTTLNGTIHKNPQYRKNRYLTVKK